MARKAKKATEPAKSETLKVKVEAPIVSEPKKAAVKKVKKTAAPIPAADQSCYIVVDHPADKEVISGLHYAIRLGASDNGTVEISFNGGDWQPCRQAAGYWWFDWGYFAPGKQKITARLVDSQGNTLVKSKTVTCNIV